MSEFWYLNIVFAYNKTFYSTQPITDRNISFQTGWCFYIVKKYQDENILPSFSISIVCGVKLYLKWYLHMVCYVVCLWKTCSSCPIVVYQIIGLWISLKPVIPISILMYSTKIPQESMGSVIWWNEIDAMFREILFL